MKINLLEFKYTHDDPKEYDLSQLNKFSRREIKRDFINNGFPITKELLPNVYSKLDYCCQLLNIENEFVKAYVYPSDALNASCYFSTKHECLIGISSKIIEIMTDDELPFVIGHELAHAILGHNEYPAPPKDSLDYDLFRLFRASEISADRIGFLCCDSYEDSLKALIKIASGLGENHINFDFRSFVGQLRELKDLPSSKLQLLSTHPSLTIRARALLWFSMSDQYKKFKKQDSVGSKPKDEVESLIESDLFTYIDDIASEEIQDLKDSFRLWVFAYGCASDNKFSIEEQKIIGKYFDENTQLKLTSYLNGLASSDVLKELKIRCEDSYSKLNSISKSEIPSEIKKIIKYFEGIQDGNKKVKFLKEKLSFIN